MILLGDLNVAPNLDRHNAIRNRQQSSEVSAALDMPARGRVWRNSKFIISLPTDNSAKAAQWLHHVGGRGSQAIPPEGRAVHVTN
jgi:hypothetical protein